MKTFIFIDLVEVMKVKLVIFNDNFYDVLKWEIMQDCLAKSLNIISKNHMLFLIEHYA